MKKYNIFLLVNLLLLLIITDCRCQRSNLVVNKVTLELPDNLLKAAAAQQIDPRALLQEVLDNDPYFQINPTQSDAGLLHVTLVVSRHDNELLLVGSLNRKEQEQMAFAEIALGDIANKKALSAAFIFLRQQLVGHNNKADFNYLALIKEASEGEEVSPQILSNALILAGEKKDKNSLPHVINLLGITDNLAVANACLMVLAALKDVSALPAIIDFAQGKPALIRKQAIIAARQLPCELCAQWLVVMAYGHDDPLVRKEAHLGLLEVEKYLLELK